MQVHSINISSFRIEYISLKYSKQQGCKSDYRVYCFITWFLVMNVLRMYLLTSRMFFLRKSKMKNRCKIYYGKNLLTYLCYIITSTSIFPYTSAAAITQYVPLHYCQTEYYFCTSQRYTETIGVAANKMSIRISCAYLR
mgnify:CR=1 FL=1